MTSPAGPVPTTQASYTLVGDARFMVTPYKGGSKVNAGRFLLGGWGGGGAIFVVFPLA